MTAVPARQENHDPDLVSAVNTPSLDYGWIPAKHLKPGMHLKTPDGQSAVVVEGSVPAVHDGWMWDLTVPGNNDHDFYVHVARSAVLVHNCPTAGGGGNTPLTNSQAADMASQVGYRSTNYIVKGQRVFTDGKTYITQDIDSHTGGLWKMAKSVAALGAKATRMGTYDYNLNYIAP